MPTSVTLTNSVGVSHAQREIPCLPNSSNENKGSETPSPMEQTSGGQAPRASQPWSQTGGVVDNRRHNDATRDVPYCGERHQRGPTRGPRDPNQGSCSPRKDKGPIGTPQGTPDPSKTVKIGGLSVFLTEKRSAASPDDAPLAFPGKSSSSSCSLRCLSSSTSPPPSPATTVIDERTKHVMTI